MIDRTGTLRRRVLAIAASIVVGVLVSGCANLPPLDSNGSFVPERFFDGASVSRGEIRTLGFWSREFTADFSGVPAAAGGFDLDETFHFDDGDPLQRWALKPVGGGRYEGTVTTGNATGQMNPTVPVEGYTTANGAVLDYDGYAPGGSDMLLHFRHWMEAQADGTVLNRVRISKFGIPVSGARVVFSKVPTPPGT